MSEYEIFHLEPSESFVDMLEVIEPRITRQVDPGRFYEFPPVRLRVIRHKGRALTDEEVSECNALQEAMVLPPFKIDMRPKP